MKKPTPKPDSSAKFKPKRGASSPGAALLRWEFPTVSGHQALVVAKGTFKIDPHNKGRGMLHIGDAFLPSVAFQAVERIISSSPHPESLTGLFYAYPRALPRCVGLQLVRFIPMPCQTAEAGFVCRLKGETIRLGQYVNLLVRPQHGKPFALSVHCPTPRFQRAPNGEKWDLRCRLSARGRLTVIKADKVE